VLVETRDIVIAGWRRFASTRDRWFSDAEIVEHMFGRRTYDVLVDVFGIPPADATVLLAGGLGDKRTEVAAGSPLHEIPGAASFVRAALADGIPCAVASSASRVNIELALDEIGLRDAFDVVVDDGQVERGKPAPDPYLAAARRLGVDPRRCVVFEDTTPGIEAGLAARARCVGVLTLRRPALLRRAHLLIDDFLGRTPATLIDELEATHPVPGRAAGPAT
jgi:beta-phosphoglucomutase-like phosphatase (HAD superfamily)